jgi:hypothetical protein
LAINFFLDLTGPFNQDSRHVSKLEAAERERFIVGGRNSLAMEDEFGKLGFFAASSKSIKLRGFCNMAASFFKVADFMGKPFVGVLFVGEPFVGEPFVGETFVGESFIGSLLGEPFVGEPFVSAHFVAGIILSLVEDNGFIIAGEVTDFVIYLLMGEVFPLFNSEDMIELIGMVN